MPTFDEFGGDEWICQVCGRTHSCRVASTWRPDITGHASAGNVCPVCLAAHERLGLTGQQLAIAIEQQLEPATPLSLYEFCRRESGLQGRQLQQYIDRYYGFGG